MRRISRVVMKGSAVCMARVHKGMSMTQLAAEAGVSTAAISKIEQGEVRAVRPLTAKKLCDALGMPFDELFIIERSGANGEKESVQIGHRQ